MIRFAVLIIGSGIILGATASADDFQPTIEWVGDQDGDWDDPENWNTGELPGPGDDVLIEGVQGTITISTGTHETRSLLSERRLRVTDGSLAIAEDSEIQSGGLEVTGGMVAIANTLEVAGVLDFNDGTLEGEGSLVIQDGLTMSGTATRELHTELELHGQSEDSRSTSFSRRLDMGDSARIVNHGEYRITGSTGSSEYIRTSDQAVEDQDPRFVNKGTLIRAEDDNTIRFDGVVFDNEGTVEVQTGTLRLDDAKQYDDGALMGGTWQISEAGRLQAEHDAPISTNQAAVVLRGEESRFDGIDALVSNEGLFSIGEGREFTTAGSLENSGEIVVGPESILELSQSPLAITESGALSGNGRVIGDVTSNGTVRSGVNEGSLEIDGAYTQETSGTLAVRLGEDGGGFLQVGNEAVLAGTLSLALGEDYLPQPPDERAVLTAGSVSGTFDTESFSELPITMFSELRYEDDAVVLVIDPRNFESWLDDHLSAEELENPEFTDPRGDPGSYGIPMLLRYAFDLDPRNPDRAGLPNEVDFHEIEGDAEYLTITFTRRLDATDLEYRVQGGFEPGELEVLPDQEELVVDIDEGDIERTESVTKRDVVPISQADRRFLRVEVGLIEP